MAPRPPLNRLFALLIFALNETAFAVEAPYTEHFDAYPKGGTPSNFSTHVSGGGVFFLSNWDIQNKSGTAGAYHNHVSGDFVQASAAVSVTNLAQSDFLLSTTFVVNGYGSFQPTLMNIRVGLGAFASSADFFMSGYQLSYQLANNGNSFPAVGALELHKNNFIIAGTTFTGLPVTIGTTYTMTLMGDYSPSGLQLMATLNDGSSSLSFTTNDPNPPQGTYFGYYDNASGLTNHAVYADVSYDNFSLTVPEPCIVWLLTLGVAAIGARRVWRGQKRLRVVG
jgi:hypothetical protein